MLLWILRLGLAAAALSYLVGLGVYFAGLQAGLGRGGTMALLRELTLYLFCPLPVLLGLALLLRAWASLCLLLLPLALFLGVYGPQFWPHTPPAIAGASLRVLSFNTGGNTGAGQLEPLLRTVRAVDADLVALQEVPPATLERLPAELAAAYPYSLGTADTLLFSRRPLDARGSFQLGDGAYLAEQALVHLTGSDLVVTNVHVTRPGYSVRWRRGLVPVIREYSPGWRDAQVDALVARLRATPGPQLLMGDFNETEWSYPYQQLRTILADSYRDAGYGFGHTYPSHLLRVPGQPALPLLRIDYIFHSAELTALHAWVGPDGGSDHLPVVAELAPR